MNSTNGRQDWLSSLPSHWITPALSLRYDIALGKMVDEKAVIGTHLVPYLRNVDVQWDAVNFDALPEIDILPTQAERYLLETGDLLVCEGGEPGRAAIWNGQIAPCAYQKALHRLRPIRDDEHVRFMYYTLRALVATGIIGADQGKSTIGHLPAEDLRRMRLPKPPLEEQIAIAELLDSQTASADALISEYERLISLLQEKRRAAMANVVRCGLDSASRTESRIAHIGEIPSHWKVMPLKYCVKISSGSTPDKSNREYWEGGDIPWASAKDLKVDTLLDTEDHITQSAISSGIKIIPKDTVLIVVRGMILIRTLPVAITGQPMAINQDLKALRPNELVRAEYLAAVLRSFEPAILAMADTAGHGTKVLRSEDWTNFMIPIPPLEEQDRIVLRIRADEDAITSLVSLAEKGISLSKERREALIIAAVTGQLNPVSGTRAGAIA